MMKGKRKLKPKATDRVTLSKNLTVNEKKLEGALHRYDSVSQLVLRSNSSVI